MSASRTIGLGLLLVGAGCAAPFDALRATSEAGALSVSACGSSAYRSETVISSMDGPPLGESGSALPEPNEVSLCVAFANRGSAPVRVNRSRMRLRCPREVQPWVTDAEDRHVVVPAGETRRLKVVFRYSPLAAGERVSLLFDEAVSRGEHAIALPPLTLRKR